eukprot:CAMPEP_0170635062 /NCGR_PEP_ID=MMETSP0224-20130122/36998_1 /TAXON_ID=285029 /ORGANISM="Togula jolla, Strain CCCM 725" /LENGTH=34 /DNA_ID= /DNA_START= /DNA_END= /DNA_ORIENTATION=
MKFQHLWHILLLLCGCLCLGNVKLAGDLWKSSTS